MYSNYIDILSNCSKNILKDMGNIDISDVTIKKENSLSATYSIAHSMHYKDSKNKVKGDFILGFVDNSEAIPIAAAIAENIGLSGIEKFDEIAPDVINEFLNTVVGHTTTEWYKNGLYVSFSPPDLIMPNMTGLDAIVEIQESNPEAKFVVFTSTSRTDEVVTAKSLNVLSYLVKPLKMENLIVKVKEAFKKINEN